jgi:hypothetical protein
MGRKMHFCLGGCGKMITWRFAICSECEKIYGNKIASWPEWLSFLWRDEQRKRRRESRVKKHEVTFTDLTRSEITKAQLEDVIDDE